MIPALVATLLLVGAPEDPGPVFHEAQADPSMALARVAPLGAQPALLALLDTGVPLLLLPAAGLVGGVLGGVTAAVALRRGPPLHPGMDALVLATALTGGATAAALAWLAAYDLVASHRHLDHLVRTRLFLLGPAVFAALASMVAVAATWRGPLAEPRTSVAVAAALSLLAFQLGCALPTGLVLGSYARVREDQRRGSPLWEETGGS